MTLSYTSTLELHPQVTMAEFNSRPENKSYRVELTDGRHFQINETLFRLLVVLRTPTSLEKLLSTFCGSGEHSIPSAEITAISTELVAQGILVQDGVVPPNTTKRQEDASLLALHFRREIFSAERLAPIVRPFQWFFTRPVAAILMSLVVAVHVMLYLQVGFAAQADMSGVNWPLFLLVLLVSIFVHEFGHLAACQRWNCPHGPLGIGFYFFQPVFYVDVTAAWRLNRWQRAVVDLAGIYLQLIGTIFFWLLWLATQDKTWLFAIFMTDMFAYSNLQPFMKLDGYWLLSDLSGVPNLHARVGAVLGYWVQRLMVLVGFGKPATTPSPLAGWSASTRRTVLVYLAVALLVWPLMLIQMIPMLLQVVLSTPALWPAALSSLPSALLQGDFKTVLTSLQTLFLPLLMGMNLFVIGRQLARKAFKGQRMAQ
ncbi:MAG: hypothetical protein U0175_26985 [Caldilineaceae bacterium]